MTSVKKGCGLIFALIFIWSISGLVLADDSILYDDPLFGNEDESSIAISDQLAEEEVQSSPPSPSASQSETSLDSIPPGTAAGFQPREIPETKPPQSEQAPTSRSADPQSIPETPQEPFNPEESTDNSVPSESVPSVEPPTPPSLQSEQQTGEDRSVQTSELPLVRALLTLPPSIASQLRGEPKSLANILDGITQPMQRQQVTERYWELAESLALYHLALIYASDIEDCITRYGKEKSLSESETAALISARRRASQQVAESKMALTEAQCRLAEFLQPSSPQTNRSGILTAIPTDIPNTITYKTRYDQIKREKSLSPQAAFLNEAIPARYEMMLRYDKAASDALDAYQTLYFASGTSAETLLSAADKLADAKAMLIRCVTEYNKLIAAYVAETVGSEVRGDRFIGTMISPRRSEGGTMWETPINTRVAVNPIQTEVIPRQPKPVSAEIPSSETGLSPLSSVPDKKQNPRPDQNAEIFR